MMTNYTMLKKKEEVLNMSEHDSDGSDGEDDLEIYMVCNFYEQDEPLDLSMRKIGQEFGINKPKLPTLDISPKFNFAHLDEREVIKVSTTDNKGLVVSEADIANLLDPYVKRILKKFSCTICGIKFVNKGKAVTHVENKHVDCLQYKCPLCRASKGTRLAYESHLRRGHGARVMDYHPVIRSKKMFSVKSEAQIGHVETQAGQSYDLQFVTFLRQRLCSGNQSLETSCVEWIDQDQGIFRINNRHQFATEWFRFKVITDFDIFPILQFLLSFRVARMGLGTVSSNQLSRNSLIEIFLNRFPVMILSSKYFVLSSYFNKFEI